MYKIPRNYKRLSLWILLFAQLLLLSTYFLIKLDNRSIDNEKITFITSSLEEHPQLTYHTKDSRIFLKSIDTRSQFKDFNSSLCYIEGTDLVSMNRSNNNWQCKCLSGWHGKDCGQPEVIWRAFLTYRKSLLKITGPRSFERRIIYIFTIDQFSETLAEIRANELGNIVDLFVLYESSNKSDFLRNKLNNKFLENFHKKILYLEQENQLENLWKMIKNLRDDDIILTSNPNEIPNKFAINFLKYYNKWPEPIKFRLRWSVFGFFWMHPSKTIINGAVSSISYLKLNLNKQIRTLIDNNTKTGIILGDLNHFGGWFCEYCFDIAQILDFFNLKPVPGINLEKIERGKIDGGFLEDIIENGLYVDGKTELVRRHRYRDRYYAPFYALENNWKYDFLLTNLYSKIDYYDG